MNNLTIITLLLLSIMFSVSADTVDDWISAEMQKRSIPGLQLAIIRNNKIIKTSSYGYANIEDEIKVDNSTVFSINSVTKAFVGVAVMQLVEQGKLNLNSPISHYLSEIPKNWGHITIRQLMSHTSGLPEILKDDIGNLLSDKGPEDSWQLVQSLPMEFAAGSKFKYNQTNYVVIGKLINKLSGLSFQEFIIENQLEKIGMPRTIEAGFFNLNNVVKHSARRYTLYYGSELSHIKTETYSPLLQAAAGMSSTATELANWLIAITNQKLISAEKLAEMWAPTVLENGDTQGFNRLINGYTIGWPVMVRAEHPAISAVGGNRAGVFVYPKDNMSIVVLTNLMGAIPSQFVDEIAGLYIPEMKKENGFGLPKDIKTLWQQLETKGYRQAIEVAEALSAEQGIVFSENEINLWGYSLINQEKLEQALEVFKLNTYLFPQSYNTYDSLAEGYWYLGNYSKAIEGYQQVIKLKPDNDYAKGQIEKLIKIKNSKR
ncbi:MAG: serine hydrolase [Cognaticolwellia aestuarii]